MTKPIAANGAGHKSNPEKIRALRLGEVRRVLRHRYRHELPDDDAGRDDLELLLDIVSLARDARRRMKNIIETWAPWMDTAESYELVENILRKPEYQRKLKPSDLGERLNLTWAERQELAIRTIHPADLTPEEFEEKRRDRRRERARTRQARRRHKAGRGSRTTNRTTSLTHLQPWKALNMSRATWYRRQKSETARETEVSRSKLLNSSVTNLSHGVCGEDVGNSRKEVGRVGRRQRAARA
jgi:hypothetical protein